MGQVPSNNRDGPHANRGDGDNVSEVAPLVDAPADDVTGIQQVSCWTRVTEKGVHCWTTIQHGCGVGVTGLKNCCVSCYGWIWTLFGCCGGCAHLQVRCAPGCPFSKKWALSKKALSSKLEGVASLGVGIIFSLNMYVLTFAIVWAPSTIDCFPGVQITKAITKWLKVIAIGLPFTGILPTMYIAGQAKALQHDLRGLGLVAGGILLEVVYIICLGALMTVCSYSSISPSAPSASPSPVASPAWSPWVPVSVVTGCLLLLLVIVWGCCCHYPKWLRSCLACVCVWKKTCHEIDLEEAQAPHTAATRAQAVAEALQTAAEALKEAAAAALGAAAAAQEAPERVVAER